MPLSKLRAGSTVWMVPAPDKAGEEPLVVSIREGPWPFRSCTSFTSIIPQFVKLAYPIDC
jgi:hypothetical protein